MAVGATCSRGHDRTPDNVGSKGRCRVCDRENHRRVKTFNGGLDHDQFTGQVRDALKGRRRYKVDAIADQLDVSPKRIRMALEALRESGYRVPDEVAGEVELLKVPPSRNDQVHSLPLELLRGDLVRFGVVADTHLSSNECALDELHLAYEWFGQQEIDTVLHAGDLVAGVGVFRGQHNELVHHTFEEQRNHAIISYPTQAGVTTKLIAGNHDLEGDFGRVGADPVAGVCNVRDDMEYLGPYSAWLELANGAYVHLLHGKGGMSYSFSYKAQKLVDSYPGGRKPGALILGHFHVQGLLECRGVQVMFPGCFEWVSAQFGERLGLRPSVGFHIVEARLADDGSIVEWTPRWKPLWPGRTV